MRFKLFVAKFFLGGLVFAFATGIWIDPGLARANGKGNDTKVYVSIPKDQGSCGSDEGTLEKKVYKSEKPECEF